MLYGGQLSNTIVLNYLELHGTSKSQSSGFNIGANPYSNDAIRTASRKFKIQDADQIIEQSNQNAHVITAQSSTTNLSFNGSKRQSRVAAKAKDGSNGAESIGKGQGKKRFVNGKPVILHN